MGLPVRPPLCPATPAFSWFCTSGPKARQRPDHRLRPSQAGGLWPAAGAQADEHRAPERENKGGRSGGRSQIHGARAAPWGIWTCCGCVQVPKLFLIIIYHSHFVFVFLTL